MKVLFVHGFLGSQMNWSPIIQKLKSRQELKSYEFIAVDLLGHGQKAAAVLGKKLLSVDDLAEDLRLEIEKINEPVIAVGHSFGLRPLLTLCAKSPEIIKALVVEDSSPMVSEAGFAELIQIFDSIAHSFNSRDAAKQGIESIFGVDTKMSRFLMTNIREKEAGNYAWRFDPALLRSLLVDAKDKPQWKEWAQYPGPVHMIMGADSKFVPKHRQQECIDRRVNRHTELIQIDQAGHWVHADQPDRFVEELSKIIIKFG